MGLQQENILLLQQEKLFALQQENILLLQQGNILLLQQESMLLLQQENILLLQHENILLLQQEDITGEAVGYVWGGPPGDLELKQSGICEAARQETWSSSCRVYVRWPARRPGAQAVGYM